MLHIISDMARLDGPSCHPARQAAPFQSGIKMPHSKFPTPSGGGYNTLIPSKEWSMDGHSGICHSYRLSFSSRRFTSSTFSLASGWRR
jgi:hypothetical protein